MPRICLSYRRSDSAAIVGRIYDRLVDRYGAASVFMDLSDIPYGADFREHIQVALRGTDLLLVVIGPKWLGQRDGGTARIHDRIDSVRTEIQTALRQRTRIVPVLVDGAKMPSADELPRSIKDFAFRNGVTVDSGADFYLHMERLMAFTDQAIGLEGPRPEEKEKTSAQFDECRSRPNSARNHFGAAPLVSSAVKASPARFACYFIAAVILLLLAHYLIVMKWDLDTDYLHPFAVIIPFFFGYISFKGLRLGIGSAMIFGLSIALAAVAGMTTVVGLIDRHAILPQSEAAWQEAAEFAVTIALATIAGNLLARALYSMSKRRPF